MARACWVSVLASAGFSGDDAGAADDTKRPSVQVGDPFEEKRLIEACLELLDRGLVVGIQDLGGAGLTCATSETAARGHMDAIIDPLETRRVLTFALEVASANLRPEHLVLETL